MLDERTLTFPNAKLRIAEDGTAVVFEGRDGTKVVRCAISEEALADHFGDDDHLKRTFGANRERIEAEARRKYLAGRLEPDGSVLIKTEDLYR